MQIIRRIKNNLKRSLNNSLKYISDNKIYNIFYTLGLPIFIYSLDSSATALQIMQSTFVGLSFIGFVYFITGFSMNMINTNRKFLSIKKIRSKNIIEDVISNDFNYKAKSSIDEMKRKIKEHEKA